MQDIKNEQKLQIHKSNADIAKQHLETIGIFPRMKKCTSHLTNSVANGKLRKHRNIHSINTERVCNQCKKKF